jgi:CarD family transcriptional regulator
METQVQQNSETSFQVGDMAVHPAHGVGEGRFRAYTEMLKSGSPYEIAKVLRDMYRLKFDKDLSFGERRLLDQAKSLLVKELALAKQMNPGAMEGEISQIFTA